MVAEFEVERQSMTTNLDYRDKVFLSFEEVWKTEPPTKAGWYWVNFRIGTADLCVIVKYPLDGTESNMNLATHWMGPLPEPKKPEK